MAPRGWLAIARRSLLALSGVLFLGFGLAFNPGWASGWPCGLTIYSVWSTGMSVLTFLLIMTATTGIGGVTGAACSYFGVGLRRGRAIFAGWLACSFALASISGLWAFRITYASALRLWPNGYNP